jgi:DNA-binding LacI/PurR family transcriptional regulator
MDERKLLPLDVTDRVQDISTPVVVDEDTLAAHLLAQAAKRGVTILDDVDVVHVADAHLSYFAAIGAVGPKADTV